ncbi:RDD family protein [Nannocystis sp.]|uniref:RDD family protein n=1 Tax=Nannocystis sp. TaxID=1962667 RepID=UPI00344ED984
MAALYFILFVALSGRTPGQKLVGIRVINRAGGPPGPWRAMLPTRRHGPSASHPVVSVRYGWPSTVRSGRSTIT